MLILNKEIKISKHFINKKIIIYNNNHNNFNNNSHLNSIEIMSDKNKIKQYMSYEKLLTF